MLRYSKRTNVDYREKLIKVAKHIMVLLNKNDILLDKSLYERIKNIIKIYEVVNINFDLCFMQMLKTAYYKTFEFLEVAVKENGNLHLLKRVIKKYRKRYEEYRMRVWGIHLPLEILNVIDAYL